MKSTRVLFSTLVVLAIVAFATVQAFAQTMQAQSTTKTPPMPSVIPTVHVDHVLQRRPVDHSTGLLVEENATSSGGKFVDHAHTPTTIYGLTLQNGEWLSPWPVPTKFYCPVKCWFEATAPVSFSGVPANNVLGLGVGFVDAKGNSLPIFPFGAISVYSSTVDQGTGTSSGTYTFHTNVVPPGWYFFNGEYAVLGLAGPAGSAGLVSEEIVVTAYTPITQ